MLLSFFQKSKAILGISPIVENSCNDIVADGEEAIESSKSNMNEIWTDCDSTELDDLRDEIYDFIRNIRDPEKPSTLEDLCVVYEEGIMVKPARQKDSYLIRVEFNPTVPHCSLATLIGLCIRIKLQRCLIKNYKLDIFIKKGAHTTEEEINKQINDKERIAAAMENPDLKQLVENCLQEED